MGAPVLMADSSAPFWARVRSSPRRILVLDYDGTLAPFRVNRASARPYDGVSTELASIARAPRSRLVILSGRRALELPELLGDVPEIEIWGAHGVERRRPGRALEVAAPSAAAQRALTQARTDALARLEHEVARSPDVDWESRFELKPGALAIHLRGLGVTEAETLAGVARDIARGWPHSAAAQSVRLQSFDGGWELRIPGPDKGDAVRAVLADEPETAAVACLGDDLTDEDAFRALPEPAISVLVADEPRESVARYRLRTGEGVVAFLDLWRRALETDGSPDGL